MHVLTIAQYFPPDMGGGSTRASNVVKGLLNKGCRVTAICAFPHYPHGKVPTKYRGKLIVCERAGDMKVLRVYVPSIPHSSIANRVILHVCFIVSSLFALPFVENFDIIWAANPNLFCFYSALVYAFIKQKPIVRNVDDLWPEVFYELGLVKTGLMRMLLDFLAWLSYVLPAAITPISTGYKRRIVEKYGVRAQRVHVVEVGVDSVEPLDRSENEKNQFVVLYSGVLGYGYDFDIVFDAARLLEKYENIVFVIRGVGELAVELRKRIRELNLGNVVLDTQFLTPEKLSALLDSADAFLLPMASLGVVDEGLPTKVFEYQAYGKPIVCVSGGEPARYIDATRSGLVVNPEDAYGFAEAIVRIYEDRNLAARLGWNGWRYVSENLTAEKVGARMCRLLTSIESR